MHNTTLLAIIGLGIMAAPYATAAQSSTYTSVQTSVRAGDGGDARSNVSVTTIVDGEEVTDLFIESDGEDVATSTEVHTESASSYTTVHIDADADESNKRPKAAVPLQQAVEPPRKVEEVSVVIQEELEDTATLGESEISEEVTITSTSSQDAETGAETVSSFAGTVAALVTRLLYYAASIFS